MLSLGVDNNAPVAPVVHAPVVIEAPVEAPALEAPEVATRVGSLLNQTKCI